MIKRILVVMMISFIISGYGCATNSKLGIIDYKDPNFETITNSKIVNENYLVVWDKLVKNLATSFYQINNIEKESRIINVSFFIDNNISQYVDCGTRTYIAIDKSYNTEQKWEKSINYNYYCSNNRGCVACGGCPVTFTMKKDVSLSGRSNIYIAPIEDGNKTIITVNASYVITAKYNGYGISYNCFGVPIENANISPDDVNISFNTKNYGQYQTNSSGGNDQINCGVSNIRNITCTATGKFEEEILNMVR